jgi:hypothetical protein
VPLQPVQGKDVRRGKLFPEYCRGLVAPRNLKNLPVDQERDIFKTVQTENYSADDIILRSCFARDEVYQ